MKPSQAETAKITGKGQCARPKHPDDHKSRLTHIEAAAAAAHVSR